MASITDNSLTVNRISTVTYGYSAIGKTHCKKRHSDCFVYVISGEAVYTFNGKRMLAEPGNVIYLANNSEYTKEVQRPDFTHIHVDFYYSDSDTVQYDNFIYKHEMLSSLEGDFKKLRRQWLVGDFAQRVNCMAVLYGIYSKIITSTMLTYIPEPQRRNIENAVSYIEENISDSNLSISDIAKRAELSEVHFRRLFGGIHKISPVKFITNLRIKKAQELLRSTDMSIQEISEKCGFSSGFYFSRVFSRETSMTPSKYRNERTDL